MKKLTNFAKPIFIVLLLLAVFVIAAVLKVTASVVVPLTLAILLSLVFEPLLSILSKKYRIPWVLGILVIFLVLIIAISIISSLLITSLRAIISSFPKYEERFIDIYKEIAKIFNLPFNNELSLFSNLWNQLQVRNALQSWIISFSSSLLAFGKDFIMILLFAFFFMLELKDLRPKLNFIFTLNKTTDVAKTENTESSDKSETQKTKTQSRILTMFTDIITQVTRYISVKVLASFVTGVLVFFGTLIIGLDFPIVWAFLAFILNFIPNFGSIISVLFTVGFALIQFWESPSWLIITIVTLIFMTAVNFVIGNIIEPRVQGHNLGLSPFVIIASLSVWGWIWGFIGLVIAIPMMVIVKIICENFDILYPFSVLLGSWPLSKEK